MGKDRQGIRRTRRMTGITAQPCREYEGDGRERAIVRIYVLGTVVTIGSLGWLLYINLSTTAQIREDLDRFRDATKSH